MMFEYFENIRCAYLSVVVLVIFSPFLMTNGGDITVAVPTQEFNDIAEHVYRDLMTDNTFHFETLPETKGEDEMTERENLLKALRKRSTNMIMGYYDKRTAVIAEKLRVPYIVTSFGLRDTDEQVYQVLPPLNDLVDCVLDVMEVYHWSEVALFCEESILSLYPDPRLLSEMVRDPRLDVRLWVLPNVKPDGLLKDNLIQARSLGLKQFLLFTTVSTSYATLQIARDLGMLAEPYSWLMLNLGSEPFPGTLGLYDLITNITTIHLVTPGEAEETVARFTTATPQRSQAATTAAGESTTSTPPTKYSNMEVAVVTDSIRFMDRIFGLRKRQIERLSKAEIHGMTGNLQLGEAGVRDNYTFDLYQPFGDQIKKTGSWKKLQDRHHFFLLPIEGEIVLDDNTLKGKHVAVVGVMEDPWLMSLSTPSEDGLMYEGYSVDLLSLLAKRIGFTFNFIRVPDGKYGVRQDDGSWDGIVGQLINGSTDMMTAAPLSIDADREAAMDFTVPFMHRGITILVKSPEIETDYFKFMLPFTANVWFSVLVAIFVFGCLLCCIEWKGKAWRSDLPRLNSVAESWWFTFGALVGGGTESSPVTTAGRVMTSGWWFFSLILISTYTANLAAFLTVKIINPPITGVEDLLGQTKIRYGTVRDTGIETFFKNVTLKPYSELYPHMAVLDSNVDTTAEGLARVKDGDYAFFWDDSVNAYASATDCDYTNIGPPFDIKGFGVGLPSGSLYKDELSLAILRLADEGILSNLEHKWWEKGKCPDLSRPSVTPSDSGPSIEMENVAGIFFVVAGGIAVSIIIALGEWLIRSCTKCCRPKKSFEHVLDS